MFIKELTTEKKIRIPNRRGFTLVELMVSLSIFAIVMTVSIGTLLVMIDANAKAQALNSATMNLTIALDSMTRTIRTGYHYYCTSSGLTSLPVDDMDGGYYAPCSSASGGTHLVVTRGDNGNRVGYRLNSGAIQICEKPPLDASACTWSRLTSPDVEVTNLNFVVTSAEPYYVDGDYTYNPNANTAQPEVILRLKAQTTDNNGLSTPTIFNVQTRLVQQRLDII